MRRHCLPWVLFLSALLPGCYAVMQERTQLELTGQYGELVKREEAQLSSGKKDSSDRLFTLCKWARKDEELQGTFRLR